MVKRKTKEQFSEWLDKYIERVFGGNRSKAAKSFGEDRNVVYDVLGERRNPTKKILNKTGHKKIILYEDCQ